MLAEGADVAYIKHRRVSPSQHFALNDVFQVGTVQKYVTKCNNAVLDEDK